MRFIYMNLMKRTVFVVFALLSSAFCLKAEKVTVTVTNAGELSHAIEAVNETSITHLTVKGKLGGADLAYIRAMNGKLSSLVELNLKDVTLVDDGEPYYHYSFRGDAVWYTNHTRYFISKERKHVKWSDSMSQAANLYDDYYDYYDGDGNNIYKSSCKFFGSKDDKNSERFKRFDMGWQIGIGATIKKIFVGYTFEAGFVNMAREEDWGFAKVMNRNHMLTVGYNF